MKTNQLKSKNRWMIWIAAQAIVFVAYLLFHSNPTNDSSHSQGQKVSASDLYLNKPSKAKAQARASESFTFPNVLDIF